VALTWHRHGTGTGDRGPKTCPERPARRSQDRGHAGSDPPPLRSPIIFLRAKAITINLCWASFGPYASHATTHCRGSCIAATLATLATTDTRSIKITRSIGGCPIRRRPRHRSRRDRRGRRPDRTGKGFQAAPWPLRESSRRSSTAGACARRAIPLEKFLRQAAGVNGGGFWLARKTILRAHSRSPSAGLSGHCVSVFLNTFACCTLYPII
jgi:hypothetical protein